MWEGGSEEERQEDQEEENDEDGAPKCSTQTSSKVGMTLSQRMSDIMSEDYESLVVKDKLTREDAKDILDKAKTATEVTEVALKTLIGEDIKNRPYCSTCEKNTHFTRSCPVRFSGPVGREDDFLVASFFTTKEDQSPKQLELLHVLWEEN